VFQQAQRPLNALQGGLEGATPVDT